MKLNKLLLLAIPFLLAGCTNGGHTVPPGGGNEPPIPPLPVDEKHPYGYKYEELDKDPDFSAIKENCSVDGMIDDCWTIGRFLSAGKTYTSSITAKASKSDDVRIASSNEENLKIEMVDGNEFKMIAVKPGDSILTAYDVNEQIVFRDVIRVRPAYNEKTLVDLMFATDEYACAGAYKKILGDFELTIVETSPVAKGVITGPDGDAGAKPFTTAFELNYNFYWEKGDMYVYDTIITENTSTETRICEIDITSAGDVMYVYYNTGNILAIMNNCDISYIIEAKSTR